MRHSRLLVWRKPRNERWNNICVFVLHKLGLYCVTAWISICERLWIRLLLDCCGKCGHDKIDGETNSSSNFHTRSHTGVTVTTDVFPHFFGHGFVPRCPPLPTVESPLCFVYKIKTGKVLDEFPPTQTNKVGHESRYWMIPGAYGMVKMDDLEPQTCAQMTTKL